RDIDPYVLKDWLVTGLSFQEASDEVIKG
ncbi:MAG: hypothetical protein US15_C0056G0001, partial [Candidatus Moranbacteria bacterium GW2011_GWF1_36_4]